MSKERFRKLLNDSFSVEDRLTQVEKELSEAQRKLAAATVLLIRAKDKTDGFLMDDITRFIETGDA